MRVRVSPGLPPSLKLWRAGKTRGSVLLVAIALSGCNRSVTPAEAQATSSASPAPTITAKPAPSSTPAPAPQTPAVVPPVDFSLLLPFVPDAAGWTRGTPIGQTIATGVSYSKVNVDYTKGESVIRLELCDSGFNRLLLAPLSPMLAPNYSERSRNWHKQFLKIHDSPGFESWDDEAKEAEVTVVAGGRFIVNARGTNMPDATPVKSLVKSIDLAKLASLKF